jgi:hypothetical protein
VSPQIQQQQAAKLCGETLHWKDMAQKKQHRGSQQDTAIVHRALSVDEGKLKGNRNEHQLHILAVANNLLYITTS